MNKVYIVLQDDYMGSGICYVASSREQAYKYIDHMTSNREAYEIKEFKVDFEFPNDIYNYYVYCNDSQALASLCLSDRNLPLVQYTGEYMQFYIQAKDAQEAKIIGIDRYAFIKEHPELFNKMYEKCVDSFYPVYNFKTREIVSQ